MTNWKKRCKDAEREIAAIYSQKHNDWLAHAAEINRLQAAIKTRNVEVNILQQTISAMTVPPTVTLPLQKRKLIAHNTESESCWCLPKVENVDGDNILVIHRDWPEWIARILYHFWYSPHY